MEHNISALHESVNLEGRIVQLNLIKNYVKTLTEDDFDSDCTGGLPPDPRTWGREDVSQFLQYCEKEFDLEKIDMEKFQMNGEPNHSLMV